MEDKIYTTKEIADLIGIHVNTVRMYEEIGFLTPPERKRNGYRVYTDLQLEQCRLIRRAMRAEVLQHGLRNKAVEIVRLCALLDFDSAVLSAEEYRRMILKEIINAQNAVKSVENILGNRTAANVSLLTRKDAANALCVTSDTLRTWERNGLVNVKRGRNGYRLYSAADMERLNIVRTLRCANYSLSSILRLLNKLDESENKAARLIEDILNTPDSNEDIISVCDKLILSLKNTADDADMLLKMLINIKEKFYTLH